MIFNEKVVSPEKKKNDDDPKPPTGKTRNNESIQEKQKNKGHLILDATCAPADIKYPTDLNLLNECREKQEEMIDVLHNPLKGIQKRPRTHRVKGRKQYLAVAKNKKPSKKLRRKAIRQQLGYVKRNLKVIDTLRQHPLAGILSSKQEAMLQTIKTCYQQQKTMYEQKTNSIEDRIVSLSQPHVRPIVRGKAKANTEFGAKIAISLVDSYAFVERLDWNNFNEGTDFIPSIERYKERYGCYPKAVMADKLYRNKDNLDYCKEKGIRLSGPPLGRPKKELQKTLLKQERKDVSIRNTVEGKFGEGKRKYGLNLIKARLKETAEAGFGLQFLVMNLERKLRTVFEF
jgi:hypothetical protein